MSEARDKIIMFGASNGGRLFISYANKNKKYEILAIADNDVSKQGAYFHGYPVIAPAEISNYEYDYIMITSIFVLQIQDQLINELKVAKSRIKAVPKNIIGKARSHRPFNDKNTIDLAKRTLLFIIDLFDANDITEVKLAEQYLKLAIEYFPSYIDASHNLGLLNRTSLSLEDLKFTWRELREALTKYSG